MVLAKTYRLYTKDDFYRMHRTAFRRTFGKYGVILYQRSNLPHSRFAFVVSAKVSKKSAVRNLLKRRTSEWIRKNLHRMRAGRYDAVFIFSKYAAEARPAIFFQNLERLLQSIGILA